MKNNWWKIIIILAISITVIFLAFGLGSVSIPLKEQIAVILSKLFGITGEFEDTSATILTTIRMPRVLLAFLVGGGLAVAGVVTQSVLQNPLASSYTLGVSSGAALGAAVLMVMEISVPVLGIMLLPAGGFVGGLIAVLFVMMVAKKMDQGIHSHTIVLIGMVVSMFTNAILTLLSLIFVKHEHQIISWTMGSFDGKRWYHVVILLVSVFVAMLVVLACHRELDALSFGDDHASLLGVDCAKVKMRLLILAALLTGVSVCFTGTIGFVDLIAPHVSRKIVGASHRWMVVTSFLIGGSLMTAADLISRLVLAPMEIPVGAVTALIGAPFFMYIYFSKGGRHAK